MKPILCWSMRRMLFGRTVDLSADFDPPADMSRGICVVSSGSRSPWNLELIAPQKCLVESFAMIGANGKQASVSEHGVGRLRGFHCAGGQQSLRLWRLRRPQEPEQPEKSQRLRIPRPTSANATAVPITRSVHPPPRPWSPRLPPRLGLIAVCSGFWGLRRQQKNCAIEHPDCRQEATPNPKPKPA